MPAQKIQVGQVWRKKGTEETFLVTRLYNEALATYATLRPSGSENTAMFKVKVQRTDAGQTLPGFSLAHNMDSTAS